MIRIDVFALVAYLLIGYGWFIGEVPWWTVFVAIGLTNRGELSFWLPGRKKKAQEQIEKYIQQIREQQKQLALDKYAKEVLPRIPNENLPSV